MNYFVSMLKWKLLIDASFEVSFPILFPFSWQLMLFSLAQHKDSWLTSYDIPDLYAALPSWPGRSHTDTLCLSELNSLSSLAVCQPLFYPHSFSLSFTLSRCHLSTLHFTSLLSLSRSLSLSVPRGFSGYICASLAPFRNFFPAHLALGSSQPHWH